jgi:hypothetical protein
LYHDTQGETADKQQERGEHGKTKRVLRHAAASLSQLAWIKV